jgi:hypothetical protein
MRISPQGVRSIINYMSASGYVAAAFEERTEDWSEVFARPGDFAHSMFHEGESTGLTPVFFEMAMRFGATPMELGYGVEDPVYWFLEIRGCGFSRVMQDFIDRVHSVLYAHPQVVTRRHVALRSREGAPESETNQHKRKERGPGLAGVRVEEY